MVEYVPLQLYENPMSEMHRTFPRAMLRHLRYMNQPVKALIFCHTLERGCRVMIHLICFRGQLLGGEKNGIINSRSVVTMEGALSDHFRWRCLQRNCLYLARQIPFPFKGAYLGSLVKIKAAHPMMRWICFQRYPYLSTEPRTKITQLNQTSKF